MKVSFKFLALAFSWAFIGLYTVKWGYIKQRSGIEQKYFLHGNSLISVYNSHATSFLCFRLVTEGVCSPFKKFSKCPHDLWPFIFALLTILKRRNLISRWCFETKLWSKVSFSQCVQGCAETTAWFIQYIYIIQVL